MDYPGVGAFASPLVCQTLLARGVPWSHFYLGSIVVGIVNLIANGIAFRPTPKEFADDRYAALMSSALEREASTRDAHTPSSLEKNESLPSNSPPTAESQEPQNGMYHHLCMTVTLTMRCQRHSGLL